MPASIYYLYMVDSRAFTPGFIFFCNFRLGFLSSFASGTFDFYPRIDKCQRRSQIFPRFLRKFLHFWSFGIIYRIQYLGRNVPFDFERAFWKCEGALWKCEGAKGPFFLEDEAQEMTPRLLALTKVRTVLLNIREVSWHLSKCGRELEKKVNIFHLDKKVAHKNKAW